MMHCPVMWWAAEASSLPAYLKEGGRLVASKAGADGPGGVGGMLATGCRGQFDLLYEPGEQTWTQVGDAWIGVDRRGVLTPDMVARDTIYAGHVVEMAGHGWQIPVALAVFGRCGLPQVRTIAAGGKGKWKVRDAYRGLCEQARRMWEIRSNERPNDMTDDQLDDIAGAGLAVNYRLGKVDMLALELLDNLAVRAIIDALLDWPTVQEAIKKKATPA